MGEFFDTIENETENIEPKKEVQGPKLLRKDSPMPGYEDTIPTVQPQKDAIGNSDFKVKSIEYE